MYKRIHTHTHSTGWRAKVVSNYKQMWTVRRFQVSESNLLHACVELTCKEKKKKKQEGERKTCWKILVHSCGSVLWHRNSAQGSFKGSCNTERKTNKTQSTMWRILEPSFCVFICREWSFPGPLIPSCSISTQLNIPTCQTLTLWDPTYHPKASVLVEFGVRPQNLVSYKSTFKLLPVFFFPLAHLQFSLMTLLSTYWYNFTAVTSLSTVIWIWTHSLN